MTFRNFDISAPSSGCSGVVTGFLDNAITVVMSGSFKLSRMTSLPTNPVAPVTISFMVARITFLARLARDAKLKSKVRRGYALNNKMKA
jgi:hypothetical protein